MRYNKDVFPFLQVLECIKDVKAKLILIISGIESKALIKTRLEEKIEFSNKKIPNEYLEEVYDTDEEATEEAFDLFKEHILNSFIKDIKQVIKNYVFYTAWRYEKYFGNIDSIKNQYSILKDIERKNIENGYTGEKKVEYFYEEYNESIEDILELLRKELMNITNGQIMLDPSFSVCDITIEIKEPIEELNQLYEGKGWVEKFIKKWENNIDMDFVEAMLFINYEYDDVMEEDEYTIDSGCYDSICEYIEATLKCSYGWDNLEEYIEKLICIQPTDDYINQLNIFLESRFNMINDKLKDIQFEVHW